MDDVDRPLDTPPPPPPRCALCGQQGHLSSHCRRPPPPGGGQAAQSAPNTRFYAEARRRAADSAAAAAAFGAAVDALPSPNRFLSGIPLADKLDAALGLSGGARNRRPSSTSTLSSPSPPPPGWRRPPPPHLSPPPPGRSHQPQPDDDPRARRAESLDPRGREGGGAGAPRRFHSDGHHLPPKKRRELHEWQKATEAFLSAPLASAATPLPVPPPVVDVPPPLPAQQGANQGNLASLSRAPGLQHSTANAHSVVSGMMSCLDRLSPKGQCHLEFLQDLTPYLAASRRPRSTPWAR